MESASLILRPRYLRSGYLARKLRANETTRATESCPACGSRALHVFATIATSEGAAVLERARCKECSLVGFTRRPSAEWFTAFYASTWDPTGKVPADANYEPITSVLLPFLPDRNARILEIGSGYGGALETFRRAGYTNLVGSEASQKRAEHARSRGFPVALCTAEQLLTDPLIASRAPYDAIFSWHVFEHLHDPATAVANLEKLLAPGGVVFVCVPHVEAEHAFFQAHYLPHIFSYSERSIATLFERRGFGVEYLDDSLRIVARKGGTTKVAPPPQRSLGPKLLRDFGLRELPSSFKGEAALHYSFYRGTNEILEPSYGSFMPIESAAPIRRMVARARERLIGLYVDDARSALTDLALRSIGRVYNEVIGEVERLPNDSERFEVRYPGDEIIAYAK
jgi:SAM-dependent methyltransferase